MPTEDLVKILAAMPSEAIRFKFAIDDKSSTDQLSLLIAALPEADRLAFSSTTLDKDEKWSPRQFANSNSASDDGNTEETTRTLDMKDLYG